MSVSGILERKGIKVVVVSPYHVNRSKDIEDNSQTKSDYKDAKVIADLIRNGKYSEPNLPTKKYADLRTLMIIAIGASGVIAPWKTAIKQGIGIKRAESVHAAAMTSIGLTEGWQLPEWSLPCS